IPNIFFESLLLKWPRWGSSSKSSSTSIWPGFFWRRRNNMLLRAENKMDLIGPPALERIHGRASDEKLDWVKSAGFFLVHLAGLFAFLTGFSWIALGMCFFMYFFRMFAVTAGYHRYFSHRSFKTSR